jgi:predicted DNA-binding transcriptional regulator AlpA
VRCRAVRAGTDWAEVRRGRTDIACESMSDDRPPAYPSKSSLARELDCAESTIDELVRKGILPPPLRLSSGCVRWCWHEVTMALASLKQDGTADAGDPYLAAVSQRGEQHGGKASKGRS